MKIRSIDNENNPARFKKSLKAILKTMLYFWPIFLLVFVYLSKQEINPSSYGCDYFKILNFESSVSIVANLVTILAIPFAYFVWQTQFAGSKKSELSVRAMVMLRRIQLNINSMRHPAQNGSNDQPRYKHYENLMNNYIKELESTMFELELVLYEYSILGEEHFEKYYFENLRPSIVQLIVYSNEYCEYLHELYKYGELLDKDSYEQMKSIKKYVIGYDDEVQKQFETMVGELDNMLEVNIIR